jgi:hypothetical protein
MKYLVVVLAVLLGLLSFPAYADRIARQGNDWVRITDKPCTNEAVVKHLQAPAEKFGEAVAQFNGQPYHACWISFRGGVYLVYEDGDQGIVPDQHLKDVMEL